jgi:hypothetical protein
MSDLPDVQEVVQAGDGEDAEDDGTGTDHDFGVPAEVVVQDLDPGAVQVLDAGQIESPDPGTGQEGAMTMR